MHASWLRIVISEQRLYLMDGDAELSTYSVSTARRGVDERAGSEGTPLGLHEIRAMIGGAEPIGTVFVGRRSSGEICTSARLAEEPDRDWILTRILWLRGREVGRNRLGEVDTMRRFIYIHGTPHETEIGRAASHGCIRMRNQDVIELFDRVALRMPVRIET